MGLSIMFLKRNLAHMGGKLLNPAVSNGNKRSPKQKVLAQCDAPETP
jgi:hypothetical protein